MEKETKSLLSKTELKENANKIFCADTENGKNYNTANIGRTSNEVKKVETDYKIHWVRPKLDFQNQIVHFYNIHRLEPPFWSCAIDSFLEICYISICPYIEKLNRKNEFFTILYDCMQRYRFIVQDDSRSFMEIEYELALVRQPIWDYVIQNCPTFANRNCFFRNIFRENFNFLGTGRA